MTDLTVAEKAHVELSPSSAHRWMACPGSIAASRGYPNTSSVHAEEGTAAHALAELALDESATPHQFLGKVIEGYEVTEAMADHVAVYVDYVRRTAADAGAHLWGIENRLRFPDSLNLPGPMGGTCDAYVVNQETGTLHVIDLKYGKGVVVEPAYGDRPNPQLAYYGLLVYASLFQAGLHQHLTQVTLTVVQPRAPHEAGPVRSFTMPIEDLKAFGTTLFAAAREAMAPDAPRVPGDHCRFCLAKADCHALRDRALAVAQTEFAALDGPVVPPDPALLTSEQLSAILVAAPILETWLDAVRGRALSELERGNRLPGFALKPRIGNRKWADDRAVLAWARKAKIKKADLLEAPSLKSPAQVEKLAKARGIPLPETLTVRQQTGFTLTSDTDPKAVTLPSLLPITDTTGDNL